MQNARSSKFKRHSKKAPNVENMTEAQQLLEELNNHIAQLEEYQDGQDRTDEGDGKLILDNACHPSNVPSSKSKTIQLNRPTITLTANNNEC